MESFKEVLTANIKSSGIKWRDAAMRLRVPYDTLLNWKDGTYEPAEYVQYLIEKEILTWPENNK